MANTFANQDIIVRLREEPRDAEHPYARVSVIAKNEARKNLKGYPYMLYDWCLDTQLGFEMAFSPAALSKMFSGTDKTWREAKKELIDKGYLREISPHKYEFIELPVQNDTDAEAVFAQVPHKNEDGVWDF